MAANEWVHPVAGGVLAVGDPSDQTPAGECVQRGEIRLSDQLGGLPREVAGERAESPKQSLLVCVEPTPDGAHDGGHPGLAISSGARRSPTVGFQRSQHIRGGVCVHPRRHQLDGQWRPAEPPTDCVDHRRVEVPPHRDRHRDCRSIQEQLSRLGRDGRVGPPRSIRGRPTVQRPHPNHPLQRRPQPNTTGSQDDQPRTRGEQKFDDSTQAAAQFLAAVQDHQTSSGPDEPRQRPGQTVASTVGHSHRRGDDMRELVTVGQSGEIHPGDSTGNEPAGRIAAGCGTDDFSRQARLP